MAARLTDKLIGILMGEGLFSENAGFQLIAGMLAGKHGIKKTLIFQLFVYCYEMPLK